MTREERIHFPERRSTLIRQQAKELERRDRVIKELNRELDQAKRERDAAVEDLRKLAHEYCVCYACKNDKFDYDKDRCTGCQYNNGHNWQWRGPKEG